MIIPSIVQRSQLEGAHRLDAEYYKLEYLEVDKKLVEFNSQSLKYYLEYLTDGAHQTPDYRDEGVIFLSSGLIHENYIDFDSAKFISDKEDKKLNHCKPKLNDVLVSKSGKIGVATVFDKPIDCNLFEGVALLRLKKVDPYFLSVFLNSSFGQTQIERLVIGISQPHLHLEQIEKIKIPSVSSSFQEIIKNKFLSSLAFFGKSEKSYRQAEDLLLEELGLKDFQVEDDLSFVVNLSDVKSATRVDAEHFQPKYDKLLEKIKQKRAQVLTNIIQNVDAKFDPGKSPDEEFKYVELADINSSIGVVDGFSAVLGNEAQSRAKRLLKAGDVIVSSVEGSLKKVALVDKEQEGYLASTGFFQFRSEEILSEVLLALSKSIVIQWQLKKHCTGTILTAVSNESLQKMFVPSVPNSTQQKIADLVRESHEARKKSKELLEEAKRKVEEMIEKEKK